MSYFNQVISILRQAGLVDKLFTYWLRHEVLKENALDAEKQLAAAQIGRASCGGREVWCVWRCGVEV